MCLSLEHQKAVENIWNNGLFWSRWRSRYSFVTHSVYRKPRDWGLARSEYWLQSIVLVIVLLQCSILTNSYRRMASKQSDNVGLWKPSKARYEFRTNPEWQGKTSSGFCMGYLQANLAILPSSLAKDFERFCELNNAPCPLLYRSKTGELSAGFLAPDSDVRYNESSQPF